MSTKIVTLNELREHTTKDSLWVLLHGKVYDVTKFIDEHPGGDEVILSEAGKDATEAFEDVGHSEEARGLLNGMQVGEFEKGANLKAKTYQSTAAAAAMDNAVEQTSNVFYFVPLAALIGYFAWRFYY
ncbi:cytochrome b5 [Russula brevipes]|nr:cytochrome b5 [Russula brevipes]